LLSDPRQTANSLTERIRDILNANGGSTIGRKVIINLSGGVNGAVALALCIEAVGKERILAFTLAENESQNTRNSSKIALHYGVAGDHINMRNISGWTNQVLRTHAQTSYSGKDFCSVPPRARMMLLYGFAEKEQDALVICNSDKSALFLGLPVKHGDMAGDIAPFFRLLHHEVIQIGEALDIPELLLNPLIQEDEKVLNAIGIRYDQLDAFISTGDVDDAFARSIILTRHSIAKDKYQEMIVL